MASETQIDKPEFALMSVFSERDTVICGGYKILVLRKTVDFCASTCVRDLVCMTAWKQAALLIKQEYSAAGDWKTFHNLRAF